MEEPKKCFYGDCPLIAVTLAVGREHGHKEPQWYCAAHAQIVADERNPEYIESCPNCGCRFGVN